MDATNLMNEIIRYMDKKGLNTTKTTVVELIIQLTIDINKEMDDLLCGD